MSMLRLKHTHAPFELCRSLYARDQCVCSRSERKCSWMFSGLKSRATGELSRFSCFVSFFLHQSPVCKHTQPLKNSQTHFRYHSGHVDVLSPYLYVYKI